MTAPYQWIHGGDVSAFFGLMIDNISGMILMTSLLVGFGMPRDFVLGRMIPGTAVGVLAGDLIFTAMAFRLARRTGRADVTAMPLGLDTPSTFGSVILIIGPSFQAALGTGTGRGGGGPACVVAGVNDAGGVGDFQARSAPVCGWVRGSCRERDCSARWRRSPWRSSASFP